MKTIIIEQCLKFLSHCRTWFIPSRNNVLELSFSHYEAKSPTSTSEQLFVHVANIYNKPIKIIAISYKCKKVNLSSPILLKQHEETNIDLFKYIPLHQNNLQVSILTQSDDFFKNKSIFKIEYNVAVKSYKVILV